jgi:hypothetical protein
MQLIKYDERHGTVSAMDFFIKRGVFDQFSLFVKDILMDFEPRTFMKKAGNGIVSQAGICSAIGLWLNWV